LIPRYHISFLAAVAAVFSLIIIINSVLADSSIGLEGAPGEPAGGGILLGSGYDVLVTINWDFSGWSLNPMESVSTKSGTMDIDVPDAGNKWAVTVSSDSPTGQLTEYEDPQYVPSPKKITESLHVRADGGNNVDLGEQGLLISGQGSTTTPIPFFLEQQTSWYDQPLPAGRVYRMIITFTGSARP
jgi:hypothetical protein